jgi:lysophospholipase L1-like esterase
MVLVKRVALLPGVMAMLGVMAAAAIVELVVQRKASAKHTAGIALRLATVWIAWAIMFYDWHTAAHASRRLALRPGDRVACLGDSLTSGLAPIGGYPKELAAIIEAEVLDFGHPGITSEEGLRHLPKLLSQRPRVVVIELGGHDFLKNVDRSVARSNLVTLITAIQQAGGEPILMEIPRGFMVDPYAGLERELTREYDLELISDTCIRKLVLYSPYAPPGLWTGGPHLSDDGLHPNAAGNRVLAEAVARALAFQPR